MDKKIYAFTCLATLVSLAFSPPHLGAAAPRTATQRAVISEPEADFGDAPNSFGTTRASDGARHVVAGPTLGTKRTGEADARVPLDGSGDGTDDDGAAHGVILVGESAVFIILASDAGFLNVWIDFDGDGKFSPVEQVAKNSRLAAGENKLAVPIPGTAVVGARYARFRFTSATVHAPKPTGLLPDGEVEDYVLQIRPSRQRYVKPGDRRTD